MRLVTYNIHYGIGRDGHVQLDRIADAVDGADIIALQEVERFWPRSGMTDQVFELAKRLPDYWWVYGANLDLASPEGFPGEGADRRRQFGNMVLARTPISSSTNLPLPRIPGEPQSMQRGALEAVVAVPGGGQLRVYSTHLCYLSASTRIAQARAIFAGHEAAIAEGGAWVGAHPVDDGWVVGDEPAMPASAVLLGDLNFGPNDLEYRTILAGGGDFLDAWQIGEPRLAGATKDGSRIDHIWITRDLADRVRGAYVDAHAAGSDHQPLWLELAL